MVFYVPFRKRKPANGITVFLNLEQVCSGRRGGLDVGSTSRRTRQFELELIMQVNLESVLIFGLDWPAIPRGSFNCFWGIVYPLFLHSVSPLAPAADLLARPIRLARRTRAARKRSDSTAEADL
jgi:hypothetical protein